MSENTSSSSRSPLVISYLVEAISSTGASFMTMGMFFYTEHYLHWSPTRNLALAAMQGVAYIAAALLASPIGRILRPRAHLMVLHLLLIGISALAMMQVGSGLMMGGLVVLYILVSAGNWPLLESLVSAGATPKALSWRISVYSLTWSGTNAASLAISGLIIQWSPQGIFLVTLILHALAVLLLAPAKKLNLRPTQAVTAETPEPGLLAKRRLALWLSRLVLPAAFIVTYSLSAMLPSLSVLESLGAGAKTLIASIWLGARWLMFLFLGLSAAWHTRPRLLLGAAFLLLIGFLGVVLPISDSWRVNLWSMIAWQVLLGVAMGMIYVASLYFGMVLSQGSTEHGGYHEALMGSGQALGPAIAALAQWIWPNEARMGVAAVAGLVVLSGIAALVASVRLAADGRTRTPFGPGSASRLPH